MRALEIFKEICKIPHASGKTEALKDFIVKFAKNNECAVKTDEAGNIHIAKGAPKICLQAHYDMVLIGDKVEPITESSGFLRAKDSSLGADNGAAVAVILALIESVQNIEALITNNEEIGMIGANNCELKIASDTMINLDSEDINEIIVGCAGGFDADIVLDWIPLEFDKGDERAFFYELSAHGFSGGHSGIDIDKGRKNAIVELLWKINEFKCKILSLGGGEKRNSIPVSARAIIATNARLNEKSSGNSERIDIREIKIDRSKFRSFLPKSELEKILTIHNGIYATRESSVISSLNISIIDERSLKIMARANSLELLTRSENLLKIIFGEKLAISGFYAPWEREDSEILEKIKKIYRAQNIAFKVKEIHAGLECGILKQKCGASEIVSIGPTITNPHSKDERLDLRSFEQFCEVVEMLCD